MQLKPAKVKGPTQISLFVISVPSVTEGCKRGEGTTVQAIRKISTVGMAKDTWREIRRDSIGGSDISAIAGINPWKSAPEVFMEKTGRLPDAEENERMHFGTKIEPVVADEFSERHPEFKVQRVNAILQHPDHPMFTANIDRLVKRKGGYEAPLEIKCTDRWMQANWKEGVPNWVQCQAQWYLNVGGWDQAHVSVLIGGCEYKEFLLERDDEIISHLTTIALDFWKHIETDTPPEMDGSSSSTELLKFLYPEGRDGTLIQLPPTAEQLIAEFEAAKAEEEAAAYRKDEAANKLKAMLGESEVGLSGERKVSWKTIYSSRIDTKALKAEVPDICSKFEKVTVSRTFRIS